MNKISVIVPVYNVEKELERCVKSICSQTYKNLEIILVDDGSTDNSGKICDELAKEDERIKVIHQKNTGIASARLTGYQKSSGGLIGFVDSDDYINDNMYEMMINEMNNTNADIVFCDYNSITNNKNRNTYFAANNKVFNKNEALKFLANDEIKSFMWNKLYKKNILYPSDFYVGKLMEDYLCMTDIFQRCIVVAYLRNAFYNYVRRDNSIMGQKKNMFEYWNACKFRLDWYKNNCPQYAFLALNRVVRVALTCFEKKILTIEQQKVLKLFFKNNLNEILKKSKLNLHKKMKVLYYLYK